MNFLNGILDLNKITAKTAFIILLVSAFLMFLPAEILARLEITAFKKEYGKYFGFALLASSSFLLVALWIWVAKKVNEGFRKRKFRHSVVETFSRIGLAEMRVLREFYIQGQDSVDMPIMDPVVAGLMNKGVLYRLSGLGMMEREGMMCALGIHEAIQKMITDEFLGFPPGRQVTEAEGKRVWEERPEWAKSIAMRNKNQFYI